MLFCFGLLNSAAVALDTAPPPDRREVWVPADWLNDHILKSSKAVLLSREQYETLLRDAKADRKTLPEPPVPAVAESAAYTGRIEGNTLQVHGDLKVVVLTDRWVEVPFHYRPDSLGAVNCDGQTALRGPSASQSRSKKSKGGGACLLVHGRGSHHIGADFAFRIDRQQGENTVALVLPRAAAAVLDIELPPNVKISSDKPFRQTDGTQSTTVALAPGSGDSETTLAWRPVESRQMGQAVISAAGSYVFSIDAERVHADLGIVLNAALGKLSGSAAIVVPSGAKVLQVTGAEVLKWSLTGDRIDVGFVPGDRTVSAFRVFLNTPTLMQGSTAEVALPVPKVLGAERVSGALAILGRPGVRIRDIHTDALTAQAQGVMKARVENSADFVAAYRFPVQPEPPRVTVRKIAPRFDADLDTEIAFRQDGIHVVRTVGLRQREGEIFEMAVKLPAAEEFYSIRTGNGDEPDWRRDGSRLVIRWSDRLPAGQARVFKIEDRLEPAQAQWTQLPPGGLPVVFEDAPVEGVDKVNGYVALRSDASFRLEKIDAGPMEQRDGRKTPVQGDFAWFRGRDFKLALTVAKRPGELCAGFTGYALPLEDVLDVHGEFDFEALHSGVKSVRIQVPRALAAQFNFEGPQIAERKLDGDTWSISFQKEITGHYRLAVSVQAPVTRDPADASRFTVEVPRIVPLDVQRISGTWAVEANTETEIGFTNSGMNELDSLLAPPMAGYRPRHRVIGVFQFRGDTSSLQLTAVRHASAPMLTTVVDELDVDSVTGSGTTDRHQARLALRTAGEQYLQVTLPENARLLSLVVDGEPVKPVGHGTTLRVQLPAKRDANTGVSVSLLYETPKTEWGGAGTQKLFAPRLSAAIPVLKSQWRVFVPEGYTYRDIQSNLRNCTEVVTPLLVSKVQSNAVMLTERLAEGLGIVLLVVGAFLLLFVLPLWLVTRLFTRVCITDLPRRRMVEASVVCVIGLMLVLCVPNYLRARKRPAASKVLAELRMVDGAVDQYARDHLKLERPAAAPSPVSTSQPMAAPMLPERFRWISRPSRVSTSQPMAAPMLQSPSVSAGTVDSDKRFPRTAAGIVAALDTIIPKAEFKDATVREALDFVRAKAHVDVVLQRFLGEDPGEGRITLSLTNVSAIELLKYVTSLSGLKIKIESHAVVVGPVTVTTDQLITKEFHVGAGLITGRPTDNGCGISLRRPIQEFLESNGIVFPQGASAHYLAATDALVVRNTPSQLDLIEEWVKRTGSPGTPSTAGLLPMNFDLPLNGRALVFQGYYAPAQVKFTYLSGWAQARRGWFWFLIGGAAYLAVACARPWRRTLWAILVLSFFPLCVAPSWVAVCNALLAGWLAGLALERFAAWVVLREPVPASGKGANV